MELSCECVKAENVQKCDFSTLYSDRSVAFMRFVQKSGLFIDHLYDCGNKMNNRIQFHDFSFSH